MSESAIISAVETVLRLPEEEQVHAVAILQSIIETRESDLQLSEEQVAEVRRRLADPNPVYYSEEEVFDEIEKLLSEK